jgi:L-aspartate oxidase
MILSAMERKESRGLHYTLDYPNMLPVARDTILVPPTYAG